MTTDGGVNIRVTSIKDIMDQVGGKSIGSFKKGEGRLILMFTVYGDNDYVVAYIPDTKKYVITKESPKWNLLARGINYVFGDHGPQHIGEYRTFGDAFKFMNTALKVTVTYYSQGDRDSAWWAEKIRKEGNNVSPKMKAKWEERYQHELQAEKEAAEEAAKAKAKAAGGDTWKRYQAQEEAARKKAYEESQRKMYEKQVHQYKSEINEYARKNRRANFDFIKDSFANTKKTNAKNYGDIKVGAALAAASAGLAAYQGHKSMKRWEKKKAEKGFAKHDRDWYGGKETDNQRDVRKAGTAWVAGLGTSGGALVGGMKAGDDIRNYNNSMRQLKLYEGLSKDTINTIVDQEIYDPHQKEELRKHINQVYDNHGKVIDRYSKIAKKKIMKGAAKKAIGATAIGAGIGGLAAYGHNQSTKARNEEFNYRRRAAGNKKKDKK